MSTNKEHICMCTNITDSKPYLFIKKNYPVQSISVSISEFGFQNKTLNECILKDIFRDYFFLKKLNGLHLVYYSVTDWTYI